MSANDWIWLHIPCPCDKCSENFEDYWTHINCPNNNNDHDLKINSEGYLKCEACGIRSELIKWNFCCGKNHEFEPITNLNRLVEVIQIMAKATTDQAFFGRLLGSISTMFLFHDTQFNYNNSLLRCMAKEAEKNLKKNFNQKIIKEGNNINVYNNYNINLNMDNSNININSNYYK